MENLFEDTMIEVKSPPRSTLSSKIETIDTSLKQLDESFMVESVSNSSFQIETEAQPRFIKLTEQNDSDCDYLKAAASFISDDK